MRLPSVRHSVSRTLPTTQNFSNSQPTPQTPPQIPTPSKTTKYPSVQFPRRNSGLFVDADTDGPSIAIYLDKHTTNAYKRFSRIIDTGKVGWEKRLKDYAARSPGPNKFRTHPTKKSNLSLPPSPPLESQKLSTLEDDNLEAWYNDYDDPDLIETILDHDEYTTPHC